MRGTDLMRVAEDYTANTWRKVSVESLDSARSQRKKELVDFQCAAGTLAFLGEQTSWQRVDVSGSD
jgi:hypothetical protein